MLGIISVGAAVAIPVTQRMVQNAKGDSALAMAATFMQSARNRAVAERRNIIITFTSPTTAKAERVEVPSGLLTLVDSLTLEGDEQFVILDGVADTPDQFGADENPHFTGPTPVMFTSDGSLIDSAGDVTNASVFVARPDAPDTQRAVTVLGVTGLVRQWKWRGTAWQQ